MSEDDYEANINERRVCSTLDSLISDILDGKLAGIGVCAVRMTGEPVYFFLDKAPQEQGTLSMVMNKLVGIYANRTSFAGNAPQTNRSHGIH